MINIPFSNEEFSSQIKNKVSGVNTTIEFENIESALLHSAIKASKLLGNATYNAILEDFNKPEPTTKLDMLQRAMLHMAVHEQLIFFQVRIGNDGVTTKKTSDETTIYKYQADEIKNSLINTTWFWFDQLISELNNDKTISAWHNSEEKKEYDSLPIHNRDFEKWVGVDSFYFIHSARWIVQEVYKDSIIPRIPETKKDALTELIQRVTVYATMVVACERMPYELLPENIRKDIDNEQSKTNKQASETLIREKVAIQFADKRDRYMKDLETASSQSITGGKRNIVHHTKQLNENDKFYCS